MQDDVAFPVDLMMGSGSALDLPVWSIVAETYSAGLGTSSIVSPDPSLGRRDEPRYEAVSNLLWMQWWDGEHHLGRPARLVNVSRGGAMIVSPVLLAERQALRIFLEEDEDPIGVLSTVLGVLEGRTGTHLFRLGFLTPCPVEFFEAAALGFETWLARTGGRK